MRALTRLVRDERAAALVEFALILPVMLLLLVGVVQGLQLIETQRRMAHVASAVADLVAQDRTVDDGEMQDILSAGGLLMAPLPNAPLGQRVMSFAADSNGAIHLQWCVSGPQTYMGTQALSLPAGALRPNQSAIVADVSYPFASSLNWLLPESYVLQKRAILRPRLVQQVLNNDASANCRTV